MSPRVFVVIGIFSLVLGMTMTLAGAREDVQENLQNSNSTLQAIEELGL